MCAPIMLVSWSRSGLAPEGSISTIRPRKDPGLHRQCHRIVLFSISFYTSTKLTIFVALAGTRFRRVTIYRHDIIAMIPTWEFQTFNEASPVEIAPFDRDLVVGEQGRRRVRPLVVLKAAVRIIPQPPLEQRERNSRAARELRGSDDHETHNLLFCFLGLAVTRKPKQASFFLVNPPAQPSS